ncbi:hypothetical protein G3O00_30200 [Burkholderia sp. Ac-20384]|uniref:hypothetical protein n=1 Tax=Burkholderia sp. Ac-20384 TaxID=2703902 RepID=UPI00197F6385|nr:hypothetical protein [Burkholderia sp. Ac-20384]MBN3827866.1 hypothetical protein [Burkholderia sp. Ac-20384]
MGCIPSKKISTVSPWESYTLEASDTDPTDASANRLHVNRRSSHAQPSTRLEGLAPRTVNRQRGSFPAATMPGSSAFPATAERFLQPTTRATSRINKDRIYGVDSTETPQVLDATELGELRKRWASWAAKGGEAEDRLGAIKRLEEFAGGELTSQAEKLIRRRYKSQPLQLEEELIYATQLDLSKLGLTSLPPLPSEIRGLDFSHNRLSNTSELAAVIRSRSTIKMVNISHNQIDDMSSLDIMRREYLKANKVVIFHFNGNPATPDVNKALDIFLEWNSQISAAFNETNQITEDHSIFCKIPLFRSADESPINVFREDGLLLPTRGIAEEGKILGTALKHQREFVSNRLSTTPNREVAEMFCKKRNRHWVFVIDPQPHGTYANEIIYGQGEESMYYSEEEIQVPIWIKSRDIRGAYPVGSDGPKYGELIKNPYYNMSNIYEFD